MNMTPEGNVAPRRGWWSRNWKWVIPVGCLGILASCGCLGAIAFFAASSAIKSTAAYGQAVLIATTDAEVVEVLGSPIDTGILQGSVKTENDSGSANFTIPLDGPKADGTLRVQATRNGGEWDFTVLQVEVPGRPPIDLKDKVGGGAQRELAPPTPDAPPPAMDEGVPAEDGQGDGKSDIDL
jgi:hypothetical protein